MKVTNNFNVPDVFLKALQDSSWKPSADRVSVTGLFQPPMIKHLTMTYWEELEVDATDLFYRLDGTALHHVIEMAAEKMIGVLAEHKLFLPAEHFGLAISGRLDVWDFLNDCIIDAKNTGVMGVARGIKEDWIIQQNVYRYMIWKIHNHVVKKLKIAVKLRDWMPSNAGRGDYPASPFAEFILPLWDFDKTEKYIQSRVDLYMQEEVPMCTDEECWRSPDCYAVKKKGAKKAVAATMIDEGKRIPIPTEEAAKSIIRLKGGDKDLYVEHRVGGCRRCQSYCDVRSLCRKYNPQLWKAGERI
ncbi:hypothetical protein LCGC14_1672250 [marine sediment metagenome]|uniref:PD-(D/E)XK endonuclease-like domain-containing protein n=1 Tax=marine sediment metagenome TaxID=412755 RepID=A0A0F9HRP2_9ZZZZ